MFQRDLYHNESTLVGHKVRKFKAFSSQPYVAILLDYLTSIFYNLMEPTFGIHILIKLENELPENFLQILTFETKWSYFAISDRP